MFLPLCIAFNWHHRAFAAQWSFIEQTSFQSEKQDFYSIELKCLKSITFCEIASIHIWGVIKCLGNLIALATFQRTDSGEGTNTASTDKNPKYDLLL